MLLARKVARRFVAGLKSDLEKKMDDLLSKPLDAQDGHELSKWLGTNFHFNVSRTPKGGKAGKDALDKLAWWLRAGIDQSGERARGSIEDAWEVVQSDLDNLVKLFTDEGGKVVPTELKVGSNTYHNLVGFPEKKLQEYIKAIEQVFDELKGWRKKALVGGVEVFLAGPKDFRGTSGGKYRTETDDLYVRATPEVLKRTRGAYAGFDYIIVHELGHRYERKFRPQEDFDKPKWWTSRYSKNEGESFAELFAISNFGISGQGTQATLAQFEELMSTGKVSENPVAELPPHLKKLL